MMISENTPTISRAEAESRGMRPLNIPTISRADANMLNMKPLGTDNQVNSSNNLSTDNENAKKERGYVTSFAKGFASTPADILDVANIGRGIAAKGAAHVAGALGAENIANSLNEHATESIQNANLGEKSREYIDSLTGEQNLPMTSGDQWLDIAGGVAFPLGQVAKVKPFLTSPTKAIAGTAKTISKTPVKEILGTAKELKNAPLSTSLDILKNSNVQKAAIGVGKETAKIGTIATALTELPDEYTGNLLTDTAIKGYLASKSPQILKSMGKKVTNANFIFGADRAENKMIQALAKDIGVDLPFNAISNSKLGNFIANSVLKNAIFSDAWSEQIKNTKDSSIKVFKEALNKVGDARGAEELNLSLRDHLNSKKSAIKSMITEVYDKVDLSQINLSNSSNELKPITEALATLKRTYDPKRTPLTTDGKNLANFVNEIEGIYQDVLTGKSNPLALNGNDLKQLRTNTLNLGKYGEAHGEKGSLKLLTDAIDQSLENLGNKNGYQDIINAKKEADALFKLHEVDRVRTSLWQALTKKQAPMEALNYITNGTKVDEMAKIIGDSAAGKQIFNDLKRTKLSQILENKVLDNTGEFSFAKFSTAFNEGKKERELIKKLVGNDGYQVLENLSKISDRVKISNKAFNNFSGSGDMAFNVGRFANFAIQPNPISLAIAVSPEALSKLLTNKTIVNKLNNTAAKSEFGFINELKKQLTVINKTDLKTQVIGGSKEVQNQAARYEEDKININKDGIAKKFNDHIEENKKQPDGEAIRKLFGNPFMQDVGKILNTDVWKK